MKSVQIHYGLTQSEIIEVILTLNTNAMIQFTFRKLKNKLYFEIYCYFN